MKNQFCMVWGIVFLAMVLPAQATIIVIDDGDALGYTTMGGWNSAATKAVNGDYHYTTGGGVGCAATYTPSAIAEFMAGTYDVYASWGVWSGNDGATLTVNHASGSSQYTIDNTKNAAQGAANTLVSASPSGSGYGFLGTFDLDTLSNIVLSDMVDGAADAIMIRSPDEGRFLDQQSASFTISDASKWSLGGITLTSPAGNYSFTQNYETAGITGAWDLTSEGGLYNLKVSWAVHSAHAADVKYLVDLNGDGEQNAGESLFTIDQTLMADQLTSGSSVWSGYYDLGNFNLTDSSQIVQYIETASHMTAAPTLVTEVATIPEPSTLILLISGLFGLLAYAWQKRK